jgi:DNA-binding response OmpR family regulator
MSWNSSAPARASNPLRNVRILIVDDQFLIRKLVSSILDSWGFTDVTIRSSGREAIDCASQQNFDLVITDWRMRDLGGIDFLRFMRESRDPVKARTPIIFLTGNAEISDVKTARDAGVNEYLIKPFTASELMNRVRTIIERPRSFVKAPTYRGPDRRRRPGEAPDGYERRKRAA